MSLMIKYWQTQSGGIQHTMQSCIDNMVYTYNYRMKYNFRYVAVLSTVCEEVSQIIIIMKLNS